MTYVKGPNGWHKHLDGTGEPNWHLDEVLVINTTSGIVCISWFAHGEIPQKLKVLVLYGNPTPFYT
ncbi:MAG: hypothetical protein J7L14_02350, partial [Candidatus Diapherotrites archaeon]|nr:hypothetical protein [Candidatus Diapherotrites archaeon]